MEQSLSIGFAGNPNCGKTTLFNAYTGANLKVANWPGVTVEKKEGSFKYHDSTYKLVDLPGAYSLTSYTLEEQVTRQYILGEDVDVIIDVADASALERNLYLTLQLIELGKPVILALNMMDIVEKRGMEIDLHRLPEMLGIPVIPVSARRKTGLDILMHAAAHHADGESDLPLIHHHDHGEHSLPARSATQQTRRPHHVHQPHAHDRDRHQRLTMVYSYEIEEKIDQLKELLRKKYPEIVNLRWHAIKLLEGDKEICTRFPVDAPDVLDRSYEKDIINQKYDFIEEIVREVLVNRDRKAAVTDKADELLTHRILGLPIFLLVMALVFFLTFFVGDWLKGYFETALEIVSGGADAALTAIHVSPMAISLIVDGIIAGVGGILTFLPNIFILFLALAFLEDSGYMSRGAYVMDGIMGKLGLSGRAFIPMMLGFGCTVPAIMASRTLETKRDRMRTMLITPFMSCSARLPIYVLFSSIFFADHAMLAAYSMYLLGLAVAVVSAFIMHLTDRRKPEEQSSLLIELPEYKSPSGRTIAIYVWEKIKDYLTKAGTTIFIASIVMWFLLHFSPSGYSEEMSETFGSMLGRFIVPVMAPIGLGFWQVVVALIAGISAKEVVVSSCAVLFGIGNINSAAGMAALDSTLSAIGFGPLNAYVLMTFSLLYVPCAATLAVIRRETGSWKRTLLAAGFQIGVAWVVSFIVYRIGLLII